MHLTRRDLLFQVWGAVLALPAAATASGKYRGRGPKPPGRLEAEQYNLGKKIFTGKAALNPLPSVDVDEQARALVELQSVLPASAERRSELPALAGRLTPEQLDALEYYLSVRYKLDGES